MMVPLPMVGLNGPTPIRYSTVSQRWSVYWLIMLLTCMWYANIWMRAGV